MFPHKLLVYILLYGISYKSQYLMTMLEFFDNNSMIYYVQPIKKNILIIPTRKNIKSRLTCQ